MTVDLLQSIAIFLLGLAVLGLCVVMLLVLQFLKNDLTKR